MMLKRYIFSALSLVSVFPAMNAVILDVTPGKLTEKLSSVGSNESELVIRGEINASDYAAFKGIPPALKKLDLSGLQFSGGIDPSGLVYSPGALPPYSLFNKSIESLILPSSLKSIGEGSLASTSLREISIPASCHEIGKFAFYGCKNLQKVNATGSSLRIEDMAFGDCTALQSVNLPTGSSLAGKEIFLGSSLAWLDASTASEYGTYSLASSGLRNINLNPEAEFAPGMLMANEKLEEIGPLEGELPELFAAASPNVKLQKEFHGITEVGDYAFAGVESEVIGLSKGLRYIGEYAFAANSKLKGVEANLLGDEIPAVEETAFDGIPVEEVALFITRDSYDAWASDPFWSRFDLKPGESSVESILEEGLALVDIRSDSHRVYLSCSDGIGNYRLFDIEGRNLVSGHSSDNEVTVEIPSSAGKVIIVKVDNYQGSRSVTLLR